MEVAVMSLSAREQHALDSIEDGLSGTDPVLASLLATFTQLTAGEEMPVPERIPAGGRRAIRQHLGGRRAGLLLVWLTVTVVMIAVALALSHGGR
jgi:hypothetical protein